MTYACVSSLSSLHCAKTAIGCRPHVEEDEAPASSTAGVLGAAQAPGVEGAPTNGANSQGKLGKVHRQVSLTPPYYVDQRPEAAEPKRAPAAAIERVAQTCLVWPARRRCLHSAPWHPGRKSEPLGSMQLLGRQGHVHVLWRELRQHLRHQLWVAVQDQTIARQQTWQAAS